MEDYRIDSHKLIFHPDRVSEWMQGKTVYPINAEVGLAGACNHRCIFCSVDYMGYEPKVLPRDLVHERFFEMHEKGLKSVLFAGTGEPLLNKEAPAIINDTKKTGIDVALSTNGVLFTEDVAKECMESISWIRFSTSAGTEETYRKVHRGKDGDLERVFTNIYNAAQRKKKYGLRTVLGVQIVMIPENIGEVVMLAKKVKELGADQFSVKSFGWQPLSGSALKQEVDRTSYYDERDDIVRELEELNDANFRAVYRTNRMSKPKMGKNYTECYALPFHTNIDASGDVWPCCVLIGMQDMCLGNIYQNTFEEIWNGEQRKQVIERLKEKKLSECTPECRLDDMNRYLHELKHPGEHVNFI
jgi:radical SAM protein with 4Fe4S-binding SPASM domain